jgi:hypothetical protein
MNTEISSALLKDTKAITGGTNPDWYKKWEKKVLNKMLREAPGDIATIIKAAYPSVEFNEDALKSKCKEFFESMKGGAQ